MTGLSLLDLFTGHWTMAQLIREAAPVVVVAVTAFASGYMRGCRAEASRLLKEVESR